MLNRIIRRVSAAHDRRRARDTLQAFCDDRVAARRALHEAERRAERATREAIELEREQFRTEFFGKRDPVRSAFVRGDL
jgi:hypothetical protein